MDYIAMGRRIRHYRSHRGLTQERLAELAEISPSFLGHVERGSRKASLETIMRLCDALQVTPNDLLGTLAAGAVQGRLYVKVSPVRLLQEIALLLEEENG